MRRRIRLPLLLRAATLLLAGPPALLAQATAPAALFAEAARLQESGRLEDSARAWRLFLGVEPANPQARSNLGVVLARLGRPLEAVSEYRAALALSPRDAGIRFNLAVTLYRSAPLAEAEVELEQVVRDDPAFLKARLLLADCGLRLGRHREVVALLEPLATERAEDLALLYLLGTALVRAGEVERGSRVVEQLLERGAAAPAHFLLGLARHEARDLLGAKAELLEAEALDRALPGLQSRLGMVRMALGEPEAAAHFEEALRLDPNDFDAHVHLAALRRGEPERALAHARRALELRPGAIEARHQLALVQLERGEAEEARRTLEDLVRDEPYFAEAHVALARAFLALGRREDVRREQEVVRRLAAEADVARRAENGRLRAEWSR